MEQILFIITPFHQEPGKNCVASGPVGIPPPNILQSDKWKSQKENGLPNNGCVESDDGYSGSQRYRLSEVFSWWERSILAVYCGWGNQVVSLIYLRMRSPYKRYLAVYGQFHSLPGITDNLSSLTNFRDTVDIIPVLQWKMLLFHLQLCAFLHCGLEQTTLRPLSHGQLFCRC